MKNLRLLGLAIALTAANSASAVESGAFYFKGDLGFGLGSKKTTTEKQEYKYQDNSWVTDGEPKKENGKLSKNRTSMLGAGFGYNFTDSFRSDVTFNYMFHTKIVDSKRKSWAVMTNFYYDFNNTSDWTPFVNAGLGYGSTKISIDLSGTAFDKISSKNSLAWGVGAGVAWKISEGLYTDLSYKMTSIKQQFTLKNQEQIDAKSDTMIQTAKLPSISHSINVGLRMEF